MTPSLDIWLPALDRFDPAHPLHGVLARADAMPPGAVGYLGGLAARFDTGTPVLPAAALIRQHLAGDAGAHLWLCADPAWVEPDLNGARLLACGRMGLDRELAGRLAEPLRPLLLESGMQLELGTPDRWQLRLPPDAVLPQLPTPEQALGDDLLDHLPRGEDARRWRLLQTELQVLLHQQPLNADRRAHGLPPVNSLWLWGAGRLPQAVHTTLAGVLGEDVLLAALADRAGVPRAPRDPARLADLPPGWLVDLQDLPAGEITAAWWPAIAPLLARRPLRLSFASGERWQWQPRHRWRFWRRAAA